MMWLRQLRLLLWKNWKLQSRKPLVTALELVLPALFCLVLLLLREVTTSAIIRTPTTYPAYDADKMPESFSWAAPLRFAYAPDTDRTRQVVRRACLKVTTGATRCLCNTTALLAGFATEDELVRTLTSSQPEVTQNGTSPRGSFLCSIVFVNGSYDGAFPKNIAYKLRFDSTLKRSSVADSNRPWQTAFKFPEYMAPGPRMKNSTYGPSPEYYEEGFLGVQHAVDRAIIETLRPELAAAAPLESCSTGQVTLTPGRTTAAAAALGSSVVADEPQLAAEYRSVKVKMQRFPYPPYINDIFVVVVQIQLPFLVMLSLVFVALQIPKELVLEKEQKLKEVMKMMGLKGWVYWLAWTLKYVIFLGITALMMTCILCPPGVGPENKLRILRYTDISVVFIYFLLYVISTICFCFMISSFFNRANAAAAAGGITFFLSYIPYLSIYTSYYRLDKSTKLAACLLANNAMALGAYVMGKFEGTGEGSQWSNIGRPVSSDDDFSLLDAFLMMIGDSALYLVVMWYVETAFPGAYGVPKPWYFFIQPSYWCGSNAKYTAPAIGVERELNGGAASGNFEPEPVMVKAGVQICGLTKVFTTRAGKKAAVNQMNLKFYEGQITALLGHNGAGKTTTMFMLTGFLPPTSGTALLNGFDIRQDIGGVRSSLGLCPQHDILCENLTVEEHLYFFAELKNCSKDDLQKEVDYYIKTLGLEEKRMAYAQTLSGGQKRRLSVGIALIGKSKVVILDEPTSGMDPSGRRHMWDVLQKQRAGRTIVLSTHFMDEADCLGDRVAIMVDGTVKCSGSPLFLKTKYGEGYKVTMVKKEWCSEADVVAVVKKYVPSTKLHSNVGSELAYILPAEHSANFPDLFSELEKDKDKLGLSGYGASLTSLEEVFIKVGEDETPTNGVTKKDTGDHSDHGDRDIADPPAAKNSSSNRVDSLLVTNLARTSGAQHQLQQFKAMLIKRVLHTWRNRILTLSQLLLPTFFTILTAAIMTNVPSESEPPPITLTVDTYGPTKVMYDRAGEGVALALGTAYAEQFRGGPQDVRRVDDAADKIVEVGTASIGAYTFEHIVASSYAAGNGSSGSAAATALFNAQPYHAAAVSLSHVSNALLRHFANDSYRITTVNHPMPQTAEARAQMAVTQFNSQSFAYSSDLAFGMSFLASSFVVFLIKERATKAKHSQFVSGVKWYNFWLSTYVWDLANYCVPSLLLLAVLQAFDVKELAYERLATLSALLAAYGIALLPNMYLVQYLFRGPATGYVVVTFYNIVTGITPSLVVTILTLVDEKALADVLRWAFYALFPNYNFAEGVTYMFENHQATELCTTMFQALGSGTSRRTICEQLAKFNRTNPCCPDVPSACGSNCLNFQENYLSMEPLGIGRPLVFLFGQAALAWLLICLIETGSIQRVLYKCRRVVVVDAQDGAHVVEEGQGADDDDVAREKARVMEEARRGSDCTVVVSGLTKYFTSRPAVDSLCVAIPKGECFGLLGVNGAGKTTTFRMLTGDEVLSAGDAVINGYSVRSDVVSVHKTIGYCPQFDALIDQMTGEETLYMYGRLRGIGEDCLPKVVADLLEMFMLTPHAKKQTSTYSGGNKRKLSAAIAFVGSPPVVFLDEPTTGMDPVARRALWTVLAKARDAGTTLVLTSHSMDECEALCTRLAIMVNGRFRCLGSAQHLKNKFGRGYTVMARVQHPSDGSAPDAGALCRRVEQRFPGSVQKDVHQNTAHYYVPTAEGTSWSNLFSALEGWKAELGIEDYSVSQTTLEQVFIDFARTQVDPDESGPRRAGCCLPAGGVGGGGCRCWPTEVVVREAAPDRLKVGASGEAAESANGIGLKSLA